MRKSLSLYIHIPFCVSKCNYCSFVSMVANESSKQKYIESLKKEIMLRGKELGGGYEVATIYIGGGTPSCLPDGMVKSIMQQIYKSFVVKNNAEITIEVNPNTLTKDKVKEYMFAGINRVSIGLQCATKSVLKNMGRLHTVEDFLSAITILKEQGLNNISSDLIIGYPGQSSEDVMKSLQLLTKLNIPYISVYMLSVEDGTKLANQVKNKEVQLPSEESVAKVYNMCVDVLKKNGLIRYEVSNFAKLGFKSKHNQVYWNRSEYLGFGLAAHSFLNNQRFSNTSDLVFYVSSLSAKNQIPIVDVSTINSQEAKEETIMLSLRRAEGLDTKKFQQDFGENFLAKNKEKLAILIKNGFLVLDPKTGIVSATDKGFLVLNKIISELV